MTYRLRNLKLHEVSVVDSPANQRAHIVLMKRDGNLFATDVYPVKVTVTESGGKSQIVRCKYDSAWSETAIATWEAAVAVKTGFAKTAKENTRTQTLGVHTVKAMMTMTLEDIHRAVCMALREKFGTPDSEGYYSKGPWIEELYLDNAIYEMEDDAGEDHTYRISYAFDAQGAVTFGEPVEVQEVYVPVSTSVANNASTNLTVKTEIDDVVARLRALELEQRLRLLEARTRF